jgi:hypothetical protein
MNSRAQLIFSCLLSLSWTKPVSAITPFYDGHIIVDDISTHITLDDSAQIVVEYTLVNTTKEPVQVSTRYADTSAKLSQDGMDLVDPLAFDPGEVKKITLHTKVEIQGENLRSFSFNPNLTFDGKRHGLPVTHLLTTVVLPSGINRFVSEPEIAFEKAIDEAGRIVYSWEQFDLYPSTIRLSWSVSGIDLRIIKQVQPAQITEPNQILHFSVSVVNEGDQAVENISLEDDFDPLEYKTVGSQSALWLSESPESDSRLFWQVEIDRLQPGELKSYDYKLRYIGDVSMIHGFTIKPCMACVDGDLVAISNRVAMDKLVGAVKVSPEAEVPQDQPCWGNLIFLLSIVGGAAGLALATAGILLTLRRR